VDALDLARWQFGIITVYHFLFVPVTIGLSAIVAGNETAWVRTKNPQWLRLTVRSGSSSSVGGLDHARADPAGPCGRGGATRGPERC
jgi:hypothetical protein